MTWSKMSTVKLFQNWTHSFFTIFSNWLLDLEFVARAKYFRLIIQYWISEIFVTLIWLQYGRLLHSLLAWLELKLTQYRDSEVLLVTSYVVTGESTWHVMFRVSCGHVWVSGCHIPGVTRLSQLCHLSWLMTDILWMFWATWLIATQISSPCNPIRVP